MASSKRQPKKPKRKPASTARTKHKSKQDGGKRVSGESRQTTGPGSTSRAQSPKRAAAVQPIKRRETMETTLIEQRVGRIETVFRELGAALSRIADHMPSEANGLPAGSPSGGAAAAPTAATQEAAGSASGAAVPL